MEVPEPGSKGLSKVDSGKVDSWSSIAADHASTNHLNDQQSNTRSGNGGSMTNHAFFASPRVSQYLSDAAFSMPSVLPPPSSLREESLLPSCEITPRRFFQKVSSFGSTLTSNGSVLTRSDSMPQPILPPVHTLSGQNSRRWPLAERRAGYHPLFSSVPRQTQHVPKLKRSKSLLLFCKTPIKTQSTVPSVPPGTTPNIIPSTTPSMSPTSQHDSPRFRIKKAEIPALEARINKAQNINSRLTRSRRRYQEASPSKFCHICQKNNKATVHVVCTNIKDGFCRKVVCTGCFFLYKLGDNFEAAQSQKSTFTCCHCQNRCPER